jgi:hypothetical protein
MSMPRNRIDIAMRKVLVLSLLFLFFASTLCRAQIGFSLSEDGKYKAVLVRDRGEHFKVIEVATGRKILVTHAKFPTSNIVKAAGFGVFDGEFAIAAAYHYGHTRSTWIGVWSLESGAFLGSKEKSGYSTDVGWVFK